MEELGDVGHDGSLIGNVHIAQIFDLQKTLPNQFERSLQV